MSDGDVLGYDAWKDPDEFEDVDDDPLVHQYEQRITVDFDGKHHDAPGAFRLEATRVWHNLKDVADLVDVHVSTGQEGMHFVAWFEDDLDFEGQMSVRRSNADDPRRVDMDRQRFEQLGGRFTDVLFNQKGGRSTTKERRFRDVYDALDYIQAQRDDYQRMKRLANEGHKGAPDLARRADL